MHISGADRAKISVATVGSICLKIAVKFAVMSFWAFDEAHNFRNVWHFSSFGRIRMDPPTASKTNWLTYLLQQQKQQQQQLLLLLLSYMYREAKPGFFARLTRRKPRTEAADEDAMRTQETPGYCIWYCRCLHLLILLTSCFRQTLTGKRLHLSPWNFRRMIQHHTVRREKSFPVLDASIFWNRLIT